jgi:ankyrin repeat protein
MNGGEDCNPGLSDDNFISENEQASSLRIWPIAIFCILCMLVSAAAITRSLAPKASNKQEVKPRVASKGTPNLKLKRPSLPRSAQSFNIKFSEDTLRLKDKHIVFARVSEDMFKQRDAIYLLSNEGNVTKSFKSFTPDLIDASIRCDQELTATLLEDAVDLELTDTVGDTALIWAVRRSCLPIVKMLIKKGADVNATSRNGFTPYVWSRLYRSKEISKLLVKAGATIDGGIYWWRHEDDGEDKWLDIALSNACRNRNCDLD